MAAVLADFESTHSGYIHTICLIPIKISDKVTQQKGVLICIKDVIKHDIIQENPDVRKKIASSVIDVANHDLNIKYLNFYDAVNFMIDFVCDHGNTLINHSMVSDLGFLVSTQDFVGGKRIIKKRLREYPDTGMYNKKWENINKVCSLSLLSNRCPKFNEHYYNFYKNNNIDPTPGGYYSIKLETFSQFIRNDPTYHQSHSAVQDTVDLVNILKSAVQYDGKNIIDGTNYIAKPDWKRAVL